MGSQAAERGMGLLGLGREGGCRIGRVGLGGEDGGRGSEDLTVQGHGCSVQRDGDCGLRIENWRECIKKGVR